jgi:hypothetical protein
MCNSIYQNLLDLDCWLLREEFGKVNLSNCCLQKDDEGKVLEEIADQMRKITHVPVQTQKSWIHGELCGGWFSIFGGFKTLINVMFFILEACLFCSARPS